MSVIYKLTGWLECPIEFGDEIENELKHLKNQFRDCSERLTCLVPWSRPENALNLIAYFTFAADISRDTKPLFEDIIQRLCDRKFGLRGFFYLQAEELMVHIYLKVREDRIEIVDPAPSLMD